MAAPCASNPHKSDCIGSSPHQADDQRPSKILKRDKQAKKHHLKFLGPTQDDHLPPPTNDLDQPATTHTSSPSPLLRLPPEVFHRIASYALTSPTESLSYNFTDMRFDVAEIGVGLISTCHAIALETRFLHLSKNTLIFKTKMLKDGRVGRDLIAIVTGLEGLAKAHVRVFPIYIECHGKGGFTRRAALGDRSQRRA